MASLGLTVTKGTDLSIHTLHMIDSFSCMPNAATLIFITFTFMRRSRGGDRGSGPLPPWNLKILPKKKGYFGIFWGLDPPPPSSVTKNYHFRWTPSHENSGSPHDIEKSTEIVSVILKKNISDVVVMCVLNEGVT